MHFIDIEADFKEDDTGLCIKIIFKNLLFSWSFQELTAEYKKRINILYKQYALELVNPKYYKPGLPAKIRVWKFNFFLYHLKKNLILICKIDSN
jgi:hypothetical protein